MASEPKVTVTLRIDRGTHDLLKEAARKSRRSMNKLVEVLIDEHCKANDIAAEPKRTTKKRS